MSGEAWLGESRFCGRGPEECDGIAEPEEDGEVRYYKCVKDDCGFEFGYEVIAPAQQSDCQLGIPESVRLQHHSTFPPPAPAPGGRVFLGTTITRRAE